MIWPLCHPPRVMSEGFDRLEEELATLPEDVTPRLAIRRDPRSAKRLILPPLELHRDVPVEDQVWDHLFEHCSEGGTFELRLRAPNVDACVHVHLEFRGRGQEPQPAARIPNPGAPAPVPPPPAPPVDPLKLLMDQAEQFAKVRALFVPETDEDDDADEDEGEDDGGADNESGIDEPTGLAGVVAKFAEDEAGKMVLGRIGATFADLMEGGADYLKAKAKQAVVPSGLGSPPLRVVRPERASGGDDAS